MVAQRESPTLTAAIAVALQQREVPASSASLTEQAALAVLNTAYSDWADDPGADLAALMHQALADLRDAVAGASGQTAARNRP